MKTGGGQPFVQFFGQLFKNKTCNIFLKQLIKNLQIKYFYAGVARPVLGPKFDVRYVLTMKFLTLLLLWQTEAEKTFI